MSAHVVSVNRAFNNTIVEVKVLKNVEDVNPDSGLVVILESARKIIEAALKKRNCIKFQLTCDGIFQVNLYYNLKHIHVILPINLHLCMLQ